VRLTVLLTLPTPAVAGYHTIDNIDISETCVRAMEESHKELRGVNWKIMDVLDMKEIPDGTYDAVIDKATMDSVLCGENSTANVAKMLAGVSRVLKSVGVYFCVSYGIPDNRLTYLDNEAYGWTVKVHTVAKPNVSAASSASASSSVDATSVHYVYVCQKTS
jgi:EEF1A lysine methyltransferase 4